jgi:hypothetical protein
MQYNHSDVYISECNCKICKRDNLLNVLKKDIENKRNFYQEVDKAFNNINIIELEWVLSRIKELSCK